LRKRYYVAIDAAGLGHLREADPPIRWHEYADLLVMPTSVEESSQIGLIAA
jgi:hypothetical protein